MFPVSRAWADLRFADLSLDPSERRAGCYAGDPRTANYSGYGLASANTLRSWLTMWSLTTSACRAEPHLARITEPALVVQSTGDQGCFPSDAQRHLRRAGQHRQDAGVAAGRPLLPRPARRPATGGRPHRRLAGRPRRLA